VPDGGAEDQRHQRLYDDLRKKLLDLSRRNPMLNYKHRAGSRRQLRIVDASLEAAFAELTAKQRELPFAPLPEPDDTCRTIGGDLVGNEAGPAAIAGSD
jgi:hypothetical protein